MLFIGTQFSILYTSMYSPAGAVIAVVVLIAWGGRYEGAFDKDNRHGRGTQIDKDNRHGRGTLGGGLRGHR